MDMHSRRSLPSFDAKKIDSGTVSYRWAGKITTCRGLYFLSDEERSGAIVKRWVWFLQLPSASLPMDAAYGCGSIVD